MLELTEQNAAAILHAHGHVGDPHTAKVRELSGGVSNAVFLIEQGAERFVVKQARGKLRVAADWQCSVERIWREVEVLWAFYGLLKPDPDSLPKLVPEVLWTDRELYAYAMTAAGDDSRPWKELLLAGQSAIDITDDAAYLLAIIHGQTWHDPYNLDTFGDRTFFAQLRLEPYYLAAAENYLALREPLRALVDQTWRERHALVHGDYSPKNMLVGTTPPFFLIDFEVGHYGDPAFDVGFFLTHLVLKTIHLPGNRDFLLESIRRFWHCYLDMLQNEHAKDCLEHGPELASELPQHEHRCVQHLAGCLVARVHGKSPVDYLTPAEQLRAVKLSEQLFALGPAANWNDAYETLRREIDDS